MKYENDQQIFDAAARWLLRPGASRCVNDMGSCCYILGDNRCAIGGIVPEDVAREWQAVSGFPLIRDLPYEEVFPTRSIELLGRLQSIHDLYAQEEWRARLRTLAADRELSADVLDEVPAS